MKTSLKLSQTVHDILRLLGTCCIFSNHQKLSVGQQISTGFPIFFFKALCRWSTGKVIIPGELTWIVFFICPVLVGDLWGHLHFRRPGSSRGRGEKTEALPGWENDDGWCMASCFFSSPFSWHDSIQTLILNTWDLQYITLHDLQELSKYFEST